MLPDTETQTIDHDGKDSFDLLQRLAEFDRLRQSTARRVVRDYMVSNAMPSNAQTLIDVHTNGVLDGTFI